MGQITRQVISEFKHLPLILGKVLGGFVAVIGFMLAVLIVTRSSDIPPVTILPLLLVSGTGIVVFVLSDRKLTKRGAIAGLKLQPPDRIRMNILSWALLLLFAGSFLTFIWLMSR